MGRNEMRIPALDVLIDNAGIGYLGAFMDTPIETWKRVLQVNLNGVVDGCRASLPDLLRAGKGVASSISHPWQGWWPCRT